MGRSPCCSKEGLNKGAWTAMEDKILTDYINIHGEGKWRHLPKRAGLKRCGKSCRLRWLNYLRPGIKRGNITNDEEDLIIRLHNLLGNRWSLIAGRLPGRTDNEIKNYWNTNIGRRLQNGTTQNCSSSTLLQPDPNPKPKPKTREWNYLQNNISSCLVQTKATRWPNNNKVILTKEITKQNDDQANNDHNHHINHNNSDDANNVTGYKTKGSSSSSQSNNNKSTDEELDFMADFQMMEGNNIYSELFKMDFAESSSCLENNMLEGSLNNNNNNNNNPLYPKLSFNDDNTTNVNEYSHFHGPSSWADSLLYDTDFDFQPMATFMESGFDWL
ncbi:hypothetical protein PIB30_054038 [Stylosanthes scabra]|uniref:Uncharacterized protein n=1 Tax=Stylosanthes scabra TaxID=79078 RepID=A0ABU6RIU2_9FABA|nr:hypothetical protein [Stylosanthes scabra]